MSKSWKIGEIKYRKNITCCNCNQKGHFQNQCSKLVAFRDKEVNIAARDSNDALVCCVKNMVEVSIMDSGASFHATYCKEELERFKLLLLLDEEGYHVGFGDQQWKVTKGSLVVAHENKRRSLYMVEVHPEGIGAIIDGSGSAALWVGEVEEAFLHNVREDKETKEIAAGVAIEPNIQSREHEASCRGFEDVMGRFSKYDLLNLQHTLRSDRVVYSRGGMVSVANEMRYSFWGTKSQQVIRSKDITFVDSIYGARSATDSSSLTKPIQKSQVVLVDIPENLTENYSIAKHGLSLDSEPRREAPRLHRYEDPPESPRLCWERRKPRVRVKEKFVRIKASTETMVDDMLVAGSDMAEFNKPKRWLPLVFEMKDICSEKKVLGYVLTVGVTTVEWESRLQKSITIWQKLVQVLISEGSLSLLKILRTKCLVEMFTGLVMKEKLKFCVASASL
ncbi:retrovirus-related pol polyprotein from transposon TNT 1-94 [Tanacetum coccineum]